MAEPLVWLPLDGSIRNLGLFDSVVTNNGATTDVNGKIGQCYVTGNSKYITATCPDLSTSEWSICVWAYPKASSSDGHQYIVGMNTSSASDYTGVLCFYQDKFAVRIKSTTYTAGSVTLNKWHHMVATYDKSTLKLYVNGELIYTNTSPAVPVAATTCFIGTRGGLAGWFGGNINDVRIYDCCLSDKEVHDIAQGLILHYPLNNNGGGGINLLENSSMSENTTRWITSGFGSESGITVENGYGCLKITGALTTTRFIRQDVLSDIVNDPVGTTYTISAYVKVKDVVKGTTNPMCEYYFGGSYDNNGTSKWMGATTVSGTYNFWNFPNNQWTKCVWIIRFAYVPTAMQFHVYSRDMTGTMYIRDIKMEKGSIATEWSASPNDLSETERSIVYDCSGYGHDGTIVGEPQTVSDTSRYGSSLYFPTATSPANAITSPALYHDNTAMTINIWGKMSAAGGHSYHEMIAASSPYARYELGTEPNGQFRSAFYVSETRYVLNTGPTVHDSIWHMFTLSYDGTTIRRYVDGTEYGSTSVSGTLTVPHSLDVGRMGTGTSNYWLSNAYVSDARVYATALSAEDIKELYNVGASVDNKQKFHTYEFIEDESGNIFTNGDEETNNNDYLTKSCIPTYAPVSGDKYMITLCVTPAPNVTYLGPYLSGGYTNLGNITVSGTSRQIVSKEVTISYYTGRTPSDNISYANLNLYRFPNNNTVTEPTTIHWVRMTKIPYAGANVEKTGVTNAGTFIDGSENIASIFESGDIAAANLIEI